MSNPLGLGTLLRQFAGSELQRPRLRLQVWNPNVTDISEVVSGRCTEPPLDLSHFALEASLNVNVGFENRDDPSIPSITITFRPSNDLGIKLRRGLIEDGVIARVSVWDERVDVADAMPVLTGHFRGRPGQDPGTRADRTVGYQATIYGREEQFLNVEVDATDPKPAGTDLGEIVFQIATDWMGLGQDEILIGALGVKTLHETNQIVKTPVLQALWECLFPAGKKPKFNAEGKLVAVDFDFDKPAARIYAEGNFPIRSIRYSPNEIDVMNSIMMVGLDHDLSKVIQEAQMLREIQVTIGFFDSYFRERFTFNEKGTLRAQDTTLRTLTRVSFSNAAYEQTDEFSGTVTLDTHWLAAIREIIFGLYLAIQLEVAAIDYALQASTGIISEIASVITFGAGPATLATMRLALQIASQVTLAALIWAMSFIGRGRYQIWGKPFEYCFQELRSRTQIDGLPPAQVRETEIRNDFISTMEALDAAGRERLRRELVKNQVVEMEILNDPDLDVDDVIETAEGDRFYILSIQRQFGRKASPTMSVTAWQIYADVFARIGQGQETESEGWGFNFGQDYEGGD